MAKKNYYLLLAAICMLLCGCATSRRIQPASTAVIDHTAEITAAQSRLRLYEDAIDRSIDQLESIKGTADSSAGTVDEIIRLFDEYQRGVSELILNYRKLEAEIKQQAESDNSTADNPAD